MSEHHKMFRSFFAYLPVRGTVDVNSLRGDIAIIGPVRKFGMNQLHAAPLAEFAKLNLDGLLASQPQIGKQLTGLSEARLFCHISIGHIKA
jgi:hypothetical protein